MDPNVREAIFEAVRTEPFARAMQMKLVKLEDGHSEVQMVYEPENMANIYARAHGGAIYGADKTCHKKDP